jgi:hypothetical protein
MKRYKLNTRQGMCNFFAEYVSNEISENGKYDTVISVSDCESLLLIKGYTSKEEARDVKEIVNKFISNYSVEFDFVDLTKISTIDMVTFNESKKFKNKKLDFRFDRDVSHPKYNLNMVNLPIITSEFPYGFSKNYLKNLYFYLEHILYNAQSHFIYNFIELSVEEDGDGNVEITNIITDSVYNPQKLKSIIYDNFQMNVKEISRTLENHNIVHDLLYSLNNSPWLFKKENSEFLVV